ncbi:MAG: hypothetical protein EZS28_022385 [Streblomastix strix]|uniref:Uncharacterized protein n=1 Tax=Streblomastix strix TaxID=222440 RepID=A0A5J4VHJ1_9EUKA|nr:MAG: hypothetical protein EZS28_022385 [Streblomastix strix]
MTEFAEVARDGVKFYDEQMTVRMAIKRNKKSIPFDAPFKKRQRDSKKEFGGISEKKKKPGPICCSKVISSLLDDIDIDWQFVGSTFRHVMMTKLRSENTTKKEVNYFCETSRRQFMHRQLLQHPNCERF